MSAQLQPGALANDGTLTAGSMSRAIADALDMLVPLRADEDPKGRRKLALAIAQGVIGHLDATEGALTVEVTLPNGQVVKKPVVVNVG